jgi:hypothetical protein
MIRQINGICPETDRFALKLIASVGGTGERLGLSAKKRRKLVALARDGTSKLSKFYFKGEPVFTHPFPDDANVPVKLSRMDVARVGEQLAETHGTKTGAIPTGTRESLCWLYALATECVRVSDSSRLPSEELTDASPTEI